MAKKKTKATTRKKKTSTSSKRAAPKTTKKRKSTAKKAARSTKAAAKKTQKKSTRQAAKTKATKPKAATKKQTKAKAKTTTAKKATKRPTRVKKPAAVEPQPAADKPVKPQSSGLSAKDVQMFRDLLLEKRAQILGDVTALQDQAFGSYEHSGDQSRMPLHMAELGSDNFEHEFTLGLIEGERAVLTEIDEALLRIEEGTYGLCLATGKPIGKARLKAKPWAKYCYEYTLATEKGQQHRF